MKDSLGLPQIHLVAGKGGVGKSVLSRALATHYAHAGKHTLLVELVSQDSNDGHELRAPLLELGPGLFFVKLFADQALYEYLALKISPADLLQRLWSHQLFRALSSAMPGLADLTQIGKIWFHADARNSHATQIFDKIVVDMPSSGFVKRFLSVAKTVAQAVKVGPVAHEARLIHEFMSDSAHAVLHLVVIPEELVVNETLELIKELGPVPEVSLGCLIINRYIDIKQLELERISEQVSGEQSATRNIINFFGAKISDQNMHLARLAAGTLGMPQIKISEQFGEFRASALSEELSRQLGSLAHD